VRPQCRGQAIKPARRRDRITHSTVMRKKRSGYAVKRASYHK
jgi:hypothetical protein